MTAELTEGGVHKIFNGEYFERYPVFQVLEIKRLQSGNDDHIRMTISDGKHYLVCSVSGDEISIEEVTHYSIIQVNSYVCTPSGNRKVVTIFDLDVVLRGKDGDRVIGDPIQYEMSSQEASISAASNNFQNAYMEPSSSSLRSDQRSSSSAGPSSVLVNLDAISSLTPTDWRICARVIKKSYMTFYDTENGQGVYFYMHLIDESERIRAVVFQELCIKFYFKMEKGKTYCITGARLDEAEKELNKLEHDYEIIFNEETEVVLCEHKTNIPETFDHFVDETGPDSDLKMIREAEAEFEETCDFDDELNYSVKARIKHLKGDNCMYKACKSEGCYKKVIEENGSCEKCGDMSGSFYWIYCLQALITDEETNVWVTFFGDKAKALLGCDTESFIFFNENSVKTIFDLVSSEKYIFKLRTKKTLYEGEERLSSTVTSFKKLS